MTSRRTAKPATPLRGQYVQPFRDRKVAVRKVACPTCGAEAGKPCVNDASQLVTNTHASRRRKAIREGL